MFTQLEMQMEMEKYRLPVHRDDQIGLALNEFDFPHSSLVLNELHNCLNDPSMISRYPSESLDALLKHEIIHYFQGQITPSQILLVPGADAGIDLVAQTFITPTSRVRIHVPTYSAYQRATYMRGCVPEFLSESLFSSSTSTEIVDIEFICNPNNPTGRQVSHQDMVPLFDRTKLLVVDEVYADFDHLSVEETKSQGSMISHNIKENLIVIRSFSKAFGLAGLRIGYVVSSVRNINLLNRLQNPKAVTTSAKIAATTVLRCIEYYRNCAQQMYFNKLRIVDWLEKHHIVFKTGRAVTNFIMIQTRDGKQFLEQAAENHGLIFRDLQDRLPGENWIRMTIGNSQHTTQCINCLESSSFLL